MPDDTSAGRAQGKPHFQTVDPATGQPGKDYEGHTVDEALGSRATRGAPSRAGGGPRSPNVRR